MYLFRNVSLEAYSLAGAWKVLQGCGIRLRMGRHQAYSPDPDQQAKRHRLLSVLAQAGADPNSTVVLFMDQMSSRRWLEPARDWAMAAPAPAPIADCARSKES